VDPEPAAVRDGVRRALDAGWDRDEIAAGVRGYAPEWFRERLREVVD
jgi:hypothetical protein